MDARSMPYLLFVLSSAVLLALAGCGGGGDSGIAPTDSLTTAASEQAMTRHVVVFAEGIEPSRQEALVRGRGGKVLVRLGIINGMGVALPPGLEKKLAQEPGVTQIEPDLKIQIAGKPASPPGQSKEDPSQSIPWGIDYIDAEYAHSQGVDGTGVNVAVIDTGIDTKHPDLEVAGGINLVADPLWKAPNPRKYSDTYGHGTHVAGTIAALDNAVGVVGVAPGASLYAVRVMASMSGYVSWLIAGLDWCVNNDIDVANMSLTLGPLSSDYEPLKTACEAASAAGVMLVGAAGNSSGAVEQPASYGCVMAVSAVAQTYRPASFTCWGPEIVVAAPGVNIVSTYPGGTYTAMSGTSMAAPHVTGTCALNLSADIAASADDIGTPGFDEYTGHGIVDAGEVGTGELDGGDNHPPVPLS